MVPLLTEALTGIVLVLGSLTIVVLPVALALRGLEHPPVGRRTEPRSNAV